MRTPTKFSEGVVLTIDQGRMADKHKLVKKFLSYATKPDRSNTDIRYLVKGSKNTLINDEDKVAARMGYTVKGAAGSGSNPIESSFEWDSSNGFKFPFRSFNTDLEVWIGTVGSITFNEWVQLATGFSSVAFVFTTWWNNTEKIDEVVFVNGTSSLFRWSGGVGTLDGDNPPTAGPNEITINETIGTQRFLTAGTRKIRIKDTGGTWREFTVSSQSGKVFTVSEDPAAYTFAADTLVLQVVQENANEPASGFNNDFCQVINNQLFVGSYTSRLIYFSQNDDITDYSFSTPRVAGEGGLLTLDDVGSGISVLDENPIIFSGKDFIYKVVFTEIDVSGTLAETAAVKRLKTTTGQSALNQDLIADIGNAIAYVGHDKVMRIIEQAEQVETPLLRDVSDIIKPDFDALDFTNGHLKFHKTRLYLAAPTSAKNYILEFRKTAKGGLRRFWQPPQTFPFRRWATIDGDIHGHSSGFNETYKVFDGYSDNGNAIHHVAKLASLNHDECSRLKYADEIYVEGAIRGNTKIQTTYQFGEDGGEITIHDDEIDGANVSKYERVEDASLGALSLGVAGLSGDAEDDEEDPKFRIIHEFPPRHFFDVTTTFETNDVDQGWEILSYGPNSLLDGEIATAIKK